MKHSFRALAASVAAAVALTVSASAANFDHCADALKDMGLFQGTSEGYALDKTATRAEAATMLVRLLGKEEEAKALEYTAPYTDLVGWEAPYVQYLYENGLTSGTSDTTFSPKQECNAKMYATFLLRALGFSDKDGDFTYNEVLEKATELGVVDAVNCNNDTFLRDNMVAMSYTALAKAPKSNDSTTLLDKLVAEKAVAETEATDVQKTFKLYNDYAAANAALIQDGRYAMDMTVTADVTSEGKKVMTLEMPVSCNMQMNATDLDASKMEITGKMNMDITVDTETTSLAQDIAYYYTDGNYYMSTTSADGQTMKFKMPMSLNDAMQSMGSVNNVNKVEPISMVKKITADGNTLHMEYASGAIGAMLNSVLGSMNMKDLGMDMNIGDITIDVTLNKGNFEKMDAAYTMSFTVAEKTMDMSMKQTATVTATGDAVKVTLPTDLDSYELLSTDTLTQG